MSRDYCEQCHYPVTTCVCSAVQPISCRSKFYVLQHPREVTAAKNTARLLPLCLPNVEVLVGEHPQSFSRVKSLPFENTLLLFPAEDAKPIESIAASVNSADFSFNVIVLDGTWRKVHKMLIHNPWLKSFPAVSFACMPKSQYSIRKSPRSDSLSTLEAVAGVLEKLEGADPAPLYDVLHCMMDNFKRYQDKRIRSDGSGCEG